MIPRKNGNAPLRVNFREPMEHHHQRQHAAHALAQKRCPRDTGNAHLERRDEQNIHRDVGRGRAGEEDKWRFRIAQRRENARCHIVEKHKRQTVDVNVEIQLGVGKDLVRRFDEPQQPACQQHADQHQDHTDHRTGDERRIDRRFHVAILLCAEIPRREHGARNVAAKGERDEDQRDLIAVAHGGESVVADKFAGDEAVGDVIKLLKNDAAEQRQAEFPENFFRFAGREILIHGLHPPGALQTPRTPRRRRNPCRGWTKSAAQRARRWRSLPPCRR